MSHATTMVTPHYHLPGRLLNKTDLELLSLALRNTATSSFTSMSSEQGGTVVTNTILTWFSAWQSWQSRENQLQLFLRELGSSGCPKVDGDGRISSWFVCRNFKEEGRHLRDGVNSQMKQWKCHEQDTASVCAQEEDEPQKLHNFLISSLPDTWLNSVVQWAALTSTFCMICKTDFCRAYFYY